MQGYWRNEAETNKAILKDGWLHTGDIGEFDADQDALKITDRKKDIIVNDKGDNVAPQKVEGMLTLQTEIAQVDGPWRPAAASRRADRAGCGMDEGMGQRARQA